MSPEPTEDFQEDAGIELTCRDVLRLTAALASIVLMAALLQVLL